MDRYPLPCIVPQVEAFERGLGAYVRSAFTCLEDTFLQAGGNCDAARWVARATGAVAKSILELGIGCGAGFASPLREGLVQTGYGVDLDPRACAAATENVRRWGVSDRTRVANLDMRDTAAITSFCDSPTIVASNPPFLPVPDDPAHPLREDLPVDGGMTGDRFMAPILATVAATRPAAVSTNLCSLSAPVASLRALAAAGYRPVRVRLCAVPVYGAYTSDIVDHLRTLQEAWACPAMAAERDLGDAVDTRAGLWANLSVVLGRDDLLAGGPAPIALARLEAALAAFRADGLRGLAYVLTAAPDNRFDACWYDR